jgi:acyl-CoA thioesterase FadM
LGFDIDEVIAASKGMAVKAANLEYIASVRLGETITVRTWVVGNDGRFIGQRQFDVITPTTTALIGTIRYVLLNLSTLRPTRFSREYLEKLIPLTPVSG